MQEPAPEAAAAEVGIHWIQSPPPVEKEPYLLIANIPSAVLLVCWDKSRLVGEGGQVIEGESGLSRCCYGVETLTTPLTEYLQSPPTTWSPRRTSSPVAPWVQIIDSGSRMGCTDLSSGLRSSGLRFQGLRPLRSTSSILVSV